MLVLSVFLIAKLYLDARSLGELVICAEKCPNLWFGQLELYDFLYISDTFLYIFI